MAHQHQVVDSDIRFAINPITRAITRVEAKKSSLVVGDHNSERFTFEIPKIVEGHDMTLCNVIRVHYLNTSSENKSVQSLGVYEVDDFAPDPEDENILKFSWLISKKATKYVGPLAFTVQFACMTGFKVDYSWQSGVFSGITVSNAINAAEVVIEEYADILRQWWEQLYATSDLPITVMPVEDFEELNGNTRNGMLYILSDDPAVEDLEKIPGIEENITGLNTRLVNVEEKIEDEIEPAIPKIKQNITGLNTRLVNVEEKIEDEIEPAIQTITETKIPGIEHDIDTLNTDINRLDSEVKTNTVGLVDVRKAIKSIGSKLRYGEYTKLYEYNTDSDTRVTAKVITGLYMIRAEYINRETGYTASTSVILDTLDKESASTSFSVVTNTETGAISQYRIGCKIVNDRNVVKFIPYDVTNEVSTPTDTDGFCVSKCNLKNDGSTEIKLYGRCLYINPVLVATNWDQPFIVTPITEASTNAVVNYLEITGTAKIESSSGSAAKEFEGLLILDSASPAEFAVTGVSVKSNKGVIETSLGDIEIIDDISVYGEDCTLSVVDNTFTLYCENVASYDHGIYLQLETIDMNNASTFNVKPITEFSGDSVLHYLRVKGEYKLSDAHNNVAISRPFEGILYRDSASTVSFTVEGVGIKVDKGVIITSLGDIDITGDISRDISILGEGCKFSIVDNTFTLYCAYVNEALG